MTLHILIFLDPETVEFNFVEVLELSSNHKKSVSQLVIICNVVTHGLVSNNRIKIQL